MNIYQPDQGSSECQQLLIKALPERAKEFSRVIGLENTFSLIKEFGGTEIRIPVSGEKKNSQVWKSLCEIIGDEAADAFVHEFFGCDIYVPICTKYLRLIRDIEIRKDFDTLTKDMSGREAVRILARKYLLSNRNIEHIVNSQSI